MKLDSKLIYLILTRSILENNSKLIFIMERELSELNRLVRAVFKLATGTEKLFQVKIFFVKTST